MRAITFQRSGLLAVAVSVAMLVPLLSGCGTRQDGSGALPVLSFPRMGGPPKQTEPELPVAGAAANRSIESPADDGQAPTATEPFPTDAGFDGP